jgi:hypothetical protein
LRNHTSDHTFCSFLFSAVTSGSAQRPIAHSR